MTFDENNHENLEKFKNFIHRINHRYQKGRYLSKNNQNIKRLELISTIFPNSKILIPFRNPIQHAFSLLSQHQRFIELSEKDKFISDYMKWIGHTEFGPNYTPIHNTNLKFLDYLDINHWLEQWYLTYQNCYRVLRENKNVYFVCYEQLCSSKEYWLDILKKLNIKMKFDYEFKESFKDIPLHFDKDIANQGLSLYTELSNYQCNKIGS